MLRTFARTVILKSCSRGAEGSHETCMLCAPVCHCEDPERSEGDEAISWACLNAWPSTFLTFTSPLFTLDSSLTSREL
jgi:hypothetical protein